MLDGVGGNVNQGKQTPSSQQKGALKTSAAHLRPDGNNASNNSSRFTPGKGGGEPARACLDQASIPTTNKNGAVQQRREQDESGVGKSRPNGGTRSSADNSSKSTKIVNGQ